MSSQNKKRKVTDERRKVNSGILFYRNEKWREKKIICLTNGIMPKGNCLRVHRGIFNEYWNKNNHFSLGYIWKYI